MAWVGPYMFTDIVPTLTDINQPVLSLILAILCLLQNFPLFLSMDFRGPWGSLKGFLCTFFGLGGLNKIRLRDPNLYLAQNVLLG